MQIASRYFFPPYGTLGLATRANALVSGTPAAKAKEALRKYSRVSSSSEKTKQPRIPRVIIDIHMMIPTEDAPALETNLHEALWDTRINLVNDGKEFFRTSLSEIRAVVDSSGKDLRYEFHDHASATQWRESEKRRRIGKNGKYDRANEVPESEENAA